MIQIDFLLSENLGVPLGTATIYLAGTSTLATIYDSTGATQTNPVTLSSKGTAGVWVDPGKYKIDLKDSDGVSQAGYPRDNLGYGLQDGRTDASAYASLNEAITAIGSTPTTLLINVSDTPMTANLTIPSTCVLEFEYPGSVAQGTYTLAITKQPKAGRYQVFTGTGAVTLPDGIEVYPEWWGPTASNGIVEALASQTVPNITLQSKVYTTSVPIVITKSGTRIRGVVPGAFQATYGTSISYTGSGVALSAGIDIDNSGDYIDNLDIGYFNVIVTQSATTGIRLWHPLNSIFSKIRVYGFNGTGKIGLRVHASQQVNFEYIEVVGNSGTVVLSEYLERGVSMETGYAQATGTTTEFNKCYFHYCYSGMYISGVMVSFYNTIFEANTIGILSSSYGWTGALYNCYFEANYLYDLEISGAGTSVDVIGGVINSYGRQTFLYITSVSKLHFESTRFFTTHAAPKMFVYGALVLAPGGTVLFNNCTYPANIVAGGLDTVWPYVNLKNEAPTETYRFIVPSLTGTMTVSTAFINGVSGVAKYVFQRGGSIVNIHIYTDVAITTGAWDATTYINGASFYAQPAGSADINVPFMVMDNYYLSGSALTQYIHTNNISACNMVVEITVSHY